MLLPIDVLGGNHNVLVFCFCDFVPIDIPRSFLEGRDGNESFPNSLHLPSVEEFSQVRNLDPEVRKVRLHTIRF